MASGEYSIKSGHKYDCNPGRLLVPLGGERRKQAGYSDTAALLFSFRHYKCRVFSDSSLNAGPGGRARLFRGTKHEALAILEGLQHWGIK